MFTAGPRTRGLQRLDGVAISADTIGASGGGSLTAGTGAGGSVLAAATLSGMVYEVVANSPRQIAGIEGVSVYCEQCGESSHNFAYSHTAESVRPWLARGGDSRRHAV